MSLYSEFKTFVQRGNVVDLAVGVIMGAAFSKIVNSLVVDVLTPPIGYLVGGKKFTDLKINLPEVPIPDPLHPGKFLEKLEPATVNIGNFLQATFDFLVVAICIFLMVKAMNSLKRAEAKGETPPPEPSQTEKLLMEIRDELKARQPS